VCAPADPLTRTDEGLTHHCRRGRWPGVVFLAAFVLACTSCGSTKPAAATQTQPAELERVAGTDLQRVRLSPKASERLGIQTVPVREAEVSRRDAPAEGAATRLLIPYGAVLYDIRGDTWTYVSPEPLVFLRHQISVDYIEGDLAILLEGPPSGTAVVVTGAAELFGIELGVGK
jgi:hypothetical protein